MDPGVSTIVKAPKTGDTGVCLVSLRLAIFDSMGALFISTPSTLVPR